MRVASGTVDQKLLLRNEYLAAENQILRGQLKGRPKLSDAERAKLGEIGRRLGRKALGDVATAALPDTIHTCSHLILQLEDVLERSVKAISPKVCARLGVDKLPGNTEAIGRFPDTAFKQVADA